jgi:hypothetical protein
MNRRRAWTRCHAPGCAVASSARIDSSASATPSSTFVVKYGDQSVEFQFVEANHEMLTCIRVILDDDLMFEMPENLKVQASSEKLSLDRLGA